MNKKYNCCVKDHEDNIIHNEDYSTLKQIGSDLGLTNAMVYDLSSRKRDAKYSRFKYYPKIEINKISIDNIDGE